MNVLCRVRESVMHGLQISLKFPLYSDFKFIALYKDLGNYWKPVDAANGDYTAANPNAEFPQAFMVTDGNQGSNYRQSR